MANKQDEYPRDRNIVDKRDPNDRSSRSESAHSGERSFEIRVKGQLDSQWSDWFEGMEIQLLNDGEMTLTGTIIDQAALMGILTKLNRLNLALRSVSEVNQRDPH